MDTLHPLTTRLPDARLEFVLHDALGGVERCLVELVYQPRRERDVRKTRHWHLLGSLWRIGSRDLLTVQREEFHTERHEVTAPDGHLCFSAPLRATSGRHAAYQLAEVRVSGVRFARWFESAPTLDAGFGLVVTGDTLSGAVPLDGLAAEPLRGVLPLWPELRRIELTFGRLTRQRVELFDPMKRHHWDGWRQGPPEPWPGGHTTVVHHVDESAVWCVHEVHAFPPKADPPRTRPMPPAGVLLGVELELFWPAGERLALPDTRFEGTVDVFAFPFPPSARVAALLADAVCSRPGVPARTVGAADWDELDDLAAPPTASPIEFVPTALDDGSERLVLQRSTFPEPWLYVFGAEPAADGRRVITTLFVHPSPWQGSSQGTIREAGA